LVEWFRWPEDAELPAGTPEATLAAIEDLENQSWLKHYHRWRPWRSVEAGMARLREDYLAPHPPPSPMPNGDAAALRVG
jgi:hypothetical protein